MNILLGAISVFGLGWVLAVYTKLPVLPVIAFCLAAQVAILVIQKRKKGAK